MPHQLPLVPTVPNYRVGTDLNGVQYVLDLRWNGRAGSWYMDVRAEDGTMIRAGIRVVLGVLLGRRCKDPAFPNGVMLGVDLTAVGAGRDAGLDDLGDRVVVWFYDAQEVADA